MIMNPTHTNICVSVSPSTLAKLAMIAQMDSLDLNALRANRIQLMRPSVGLMESVTMELMALESAFVKIQNSNPAYSVNQHQERR